jgi:hypothetical protein
MNSLRAALILMMTAMALSACTGGSGTDAGPVDAGVADAGVSDTGRNTIGQNPCGCTGLQSCEPEFLDCIEPEDCEEDEDCRGSRICVRGGCYDCWGDELAACVGGQLCSDDGACQSRARCRDEFDCIDGLACSAEGRCSAPEPCDADTLEPNDRPEEARRVAGVRKGLWSCMIGDWYKVRLRKRAVKVLLRGANGPLEPANLPIISIFDGAARRALAVGGFEAGQMVAALLGEPIGDDILVHIVSPEPLRYDLAIKHSDDFCPVIDAEPNNAPDLALDTILGSEFVGSLCPVGDDEEDFDVYRLPLRDQQRVGFMIEQGGAERIHLGLLDAAGTVIGDEIAVSGRQGRGLMAVIPDGVREVFVRLRGAGSAYRLRLGLFDQPPGCSDDEREPDDSEDFAQPIGSEAIAGVLCPGTLDHMTFNAQAEDGLHLRVVEAGANAAQWRLRTPTGQLLALSRSGDVLVLDRERMGRSGRYILIASGGSERSTYEVQVTLVAGGACTGDNRDPGDDRRDQATPLRRHQASGIFNACDDPDWFTIELPAGPGRVRLRRFGRVEAPVTVELFAPGAELPVAAATILANEGFLDFEVDAAATYDLRILGNAHQTGRYQLLVLGPPPTNNTCASPIAIRLDRDGGQLFQGTTRAAHDNAESSCGGGRAADVFYFVQVPDGGGVVTFELESLADDEGPRADHILSLARLCGEASEIACTDDNIAPYQDRLVLDLDAGIYTLIVDTASSFAAGSSFRLTASIGAVADRWPFVAAADGCGAGIPSIPLPPGERGTVTIRSTTEGLSDSARGSCGFSTESRDAFFAFDLSAPARVHVNVPYAGRSILYIRPAACNLPVDLACRMSWRGDQSLAVGTLPTGRYVIIYDRMNAADGPFSLILTLSDP